MLLLILCNSDMLSMEGQNLVLLQEPESIHRDSVQVILYDFKSADFVMIKQIIVDSCAQRFDCNEVEFVWISIEMRQSDTYFYEVRSIHPSSHLSLFPKSVLEVVVFCIDETTFFIDKRDFHVIDESENAILKDTLVIGKDLIKYNCLKAEIEDKEYPVIFNFNFEVRKGEGIKLMDYDYLIESGDAGYFHKPSLGERIKMFFKKIF